MMLAAPFEGFNMMKSDKSMLLLDCCSTPASAFIQSCVVVDPTLTAAEAIVKARSQAIEEFGPEDEKSAIIFDEGNDSQGGCSVRANRAKEALLQKGLCDRVLCIHRDAILKRYGLPLLEAAVTGKADDYPSEIIEDSVFLAGKEATGQKPLDFYGITHVVSVFDRDIQIPAEQEHLQIRIVDDESENLTPVMQKALPFISSALESGGRVLVHCEQGKSRSASVVIAHLMREKNLGADEALALVKSQRSIVRPNAGFMAQLRNARWENAASP